MNFSRAIELLNLANTNITKNLNETKRTNTPLNPYCLSIEAINNIYVQKEFKKLSLVDFQIKDLNFTLRPQKTCISAQTRVSSKSSSGFGSEILISLDEDKKLRLSFTRYKKVNSFPVELFDYTFTSNYIENIEKLISDREEFIEANKNNTNPHTKEEIKNYNNAVFYKYEISTLKLILENIK